MLVRKRREDRYKLGACNAIVFVAYGHAEKAVDFCQLTQVVRLFNGVADIPLYIGDRKTGVFGNRKINLVKREYSGIFEFEQN